MSVPPSPFPPFRPIYPIHLQVLDILERRAPELEYILVDTPGESRAPHCPVCARACMGCE